MSKEQIAQLFNFGPWEMGLMAAGAVVGLIVLSLWLLQRARDKKKRKPKKKA